ncbi:MAG: GNAT family N-acetyltransferase [Candidatus Latescibacteria bacterium]|nr:GNAT family N-acetyltransferase [Candidatus Latescibacterota bacterium]
MDSFLKKSKIVEVIGYTDNENVAKELSNKDFRIEENTVAFIDLNKEMDTLFAALKSPNRRAIKKATKSGVEARKEESEGILPEIFDLLRDNAETRGYSIFDQKNFIKRISSYMREGMCDLWTARKNEEILSCLITYHDKADVYAVFGASIKSAQQLRPNNLLHWKALDYYKNHGYKKYYMGFIKSYEPFGKEITGYGEFKLKFRPELVPHYRYMKIYKKKTHLLSRVLDKVKK